MYQEFITQILETVLIPLLIACAGFLIKWLNAKSEELKVQTHDATLQKYIDLLDSTITKCVNATTQTYVERLKAENAFTKEAQAEAFQRSYNAVMAVLSEEAQLYLAEFYGDLNVYVTNMIEDQVKASKPKTEE